MEHSLETVKNCPSCNRNSFTPHLRCKDHTYSKQTFDTVKCNHCQFLFTNPRPSEKQIGVYYDNPEYVSHTDTSEGYLFKIYGIVKRHALKQKRRLIQEHSADRTVLDYGAGTGDFCAELANHDWIVSAYEPDQSARKRITSKNSKISVEQSLTEIESESKSVITLWHVLEHVHQLDSTIKHFKRILKPGGTLVIAVPNHTSFDSRFYGNNWAAYDLPRHLYHFDSNSLQGVFKEKGFKLGTIKPMWFDSFYVSLLSESNIWTNSVIRFLFSFRALTIGLLSNLLALIDTRKCSSIIYILKKAD